MNSLANLNSVVDQDHGDPAHHSWSPDGWAEPPVATICTGPSLSDHHTSTASRLHFHTQNTASAVQSAEARHSHDWDSWSSADHHGHHQLILAAAAAQAGDQYSADDQQTVAAMQDCKPSVMHLQDSLRHYNSHNHTNGNGFLTVSSSPIPMAASPSSPWPNVLSVIRQNSIGLQESNASSSSGGYNSYGILNSAGSSSSTPWQQQQQLHQNGYGGAAGSGALHNYLSESCRTGVTSANTVEQRHYNHMLGLCSSVDQQRRIHDILKGGLYSTNMGGSHGNSTTNDYSSRIGLNLGVRTYFSTEDSANAYALARFSKRFQPALPTMHVPLCQAEGCKADLSIAKHYHRRHKVCEFHSKASTVIINGNTQRFCQQCSRFHALSEFDEGKRSCRKRLADHNRRRRKPQPINTSSSGQAANSSSTVAAGDGGGASGQAPHPPNSGTTATTTSSSPTASTCKNGSSSSAGKLRAIDQESTKTETTGRTSCEEPGKAVEVRAGVGGTSSAMAAPPSVILTLQNNSMARSSESNQATVNGVSGTMLSSENFNQEKESPASYFLKGPSLSLSAGAGSSSAASNSASSHGHHSSTATVAESTGRKFDEVELSVPWLTRAHRSMGNSEMQQQGQAPSAGHGLTVIPLGSAKDSKSCDNFDNNASSHYMISDHMQSLEGSTVSDHHQQQQRSYNMHGSKNTENPWLLDTAVNVQEELRLLETSNHNNSTDKAQHHQNHRLHHAMFDDRHAEDQNDSTTARGSLPLGFLQEQDHHVHHGHGAAGGSVQFNAIMSSRPASDHSSNLSLHSSMQVDHIYRPLNGALHAANTADFIKDGFL